MEAIYEGTTEFTNREGYQFDVEWTYSTVGVLEITIYDSEWYGHGITVEYTPDYFPTRGDVEGVVTSVVTGSPFGYSEMPLCEE